MKKTLFFALPLVMLLSLLPLAFKARAEATIITYDGTQTNYDSFDDALDAADGGTLQLTADITLSSTVTIASGKNVTLDLNNHTINANNLKFAVVEGTFTLIDSAADTSAPTTYFIVESSGRWVKTDTTEGAKACTGLSEAPAAGSIVSVTGGLIYNANAESGDNKNGGCVMVSNGGVFNMQGGSLAGGKAACGGGACTSQAMPYLIWRAARFSAQ